MVPQIQCSRNDRTFTLLGLTLLNGVPLMCVVIFAGKRRNPVLEMAVDLFTEEIGSQNDADYMIKNMGKGKRFPSGPTCEAQGKKFRACVHGRLRDLWRLIYLPRLLKHLMYSRSSIVSQSVYAS